MTIAAKKSSQLKRGTLLDDRFEILDFLGAGSFGEVYSARQLIFGRSLRVVALKLFATGFVTAANVDDVLGDFIALTGLQEEAPSSDVARHLVQVYDVGVVRTLDGVTLPEPRAFMSMKLVRGKRTLLTAVDRFKAGGGMTVLGSLNYLKQLLIPLAWMHTLDSPVVHGDLKPDNVLLNEAHLVVLTDFGLASRMPVGSLGGAIAYQAPEKLLAGHIPGATPGVASDVYAVGLIWYEMLTGCHPFREVGLEATAAGAEDAFIYAHHAARKWPIRPARPGEDRAAPGRVVPASELNDELKEHPQVEGMLNRCLAHEQSTRYANALVLLNDVNTYIEHEKIDGSSEPPPADEGGIEARVQRAEAELRKKKCDSALKEAEAVLTAQPAHVAALLVKVRALAMMGRTKEAWECWATAQKHGQREPAVYDAQADVFDAETPPKAGSARTAREFAEKLRQTSGRTSHVRGR